MGHLPYRILLLVARRLILAVPDANQSWHPHGPQHKPGVATYGQLDHRAMHSHDTDRSTLQSLGNPGQPAPTLRLAPALERGEASDAPATGRRRNAKTGGPTG